MNAPTMLRWLALCLMLAVACGDDDGSVDASIDAPSDGSSDGSSDGGEDASDGGPVLGCDPLVPTVCGYPFPSTFYELDDATTPSGRRVRLSFEALPASIRRVRPDPDVLALADGWSPSVAPMAHFPTASASGLPRPDSIERSLEADSPTVLLDAETGERVPHFSEIDASTDNDEGRSFMIRPVVPLETGRRYIVAIRGLVDEAGAPVPPSPAFLALRDGGAHPHPSVEERRAHYETLFGILEAAAVARDELQLVWDFHTRSRENIVADVVHMRDLALASPPAYRITDMQEDVDAEVRLRIEGMMQVPLFLDDPGPGGRLTRDADGLPEARATAEYPFLVLVPRSATPDEPGAITQFGHGLFGTRDQAEGHTEFAQNHRHVLVSVDWSGMASEDVAYVSDLINDEQPERFQFVVDRLRQGMINALLAHPLMTQLADDPIMQLDGRRIVDLDERYYFGESQGGIFGGTYMALSTDVVRGGLRVPGQPYSLLLARSVDFEPYFLLMRFHYRDGPDIQLLVALAQMFWDVVEPGAFTPFIRDPLPDTPAHDVLLHVAIGDHQVTPLGAHVMARAIGAPSLSPAFRPIWGVDTVEDGHRGSAIVEFDFGLPPAPIENVPFDEGEDPHGKVKNLVAAQAQLDAFFRTGAVRQFCDGSCDPE